MLQENFGNRVKELRTEYLMSQSDLSSLTGIERAQISKIEQGNVNVTLETIEKISNAFQISVSKLLDFEVKLSVKPFVKWAGGKTQLLNKLKECMPKNYGSYYEPFVGGGALLFSLTPKKAIINDSNTELICVYRCLQNEKLFEKLLFELDKHEKNHSEEYYLKIREMDKEENFNSLPIYVRAARMVYLNKSCFNGLYRVNSKGYFNVPSAKKKTVSTYDKTNMQEIREYFKKSDIEICNSDFEEVLKKAHQGDFVYFDPPYDTLEEKISFTSYAKESFGKNEQKRLADVFEQLDKKGIYVMLSNHNTSFIRELYGKYNIHIVEAKRMINSKADGRGAVEEVIITNYKVGTINEK